MVSKVTSSQNLNNGNIVTGGGVDYDPGPYTVTCPAGVTSVPFDVPINDDNILENDEEFTLSILQHTLPDGVIRGSAGQAIVTIVDNDRKYFNGI